MPGTRTGAARPLAVTPRADAAPGATPVYLPLQTALVHPRTGLVTRQWWPWFERVREAVSAMLGELSAYARLDAENTFTADQRIAADLTVDGNATVGGVLTAVGGLDGTPLDASQIVTGVVPPAALPTYLARRDQANVFAGGAQTIQSPPGDVAPRLTFTETAQPADARKFQIHGYQQELRVGALSDSEASFLPVLALTRAGDATITRDLFVHRSATVTQTMNAGQLGAWGSAVDPTPRVTLTDGAQPPNGRVFQFQNTGAQLRLMALDDGWGSPVTVFLASRAGDVQVGGSLSVTGNAGNVARRDTVNTFTQAQTLQAAGPRLELVDTAAPANARRFRVMDDAQLLLFDALDDLGALQTRAAYLGRGGNWYTAGGHYERGRAAAMGEWTAFTPTFGGFTVGGLFGAVYMRVGKSCTLNIYAYGTLGLGGGAYFYLNLPAGVQSDGYTAGTFLYSGGTNGAGMMQASPSNPGVIYFYRDISGSTPWTDGAFVLGGSLTFPITS